MNWRNQNSHWGLIAISLHWVTALVVLGLFALGWWMTDLDYYDIWNKQAPFIHKSIGVLLMLVVMARIAWRLFDRAPAIHSNHSKWERVVAKLTHGSLYLFLLSIMMSGYLISTADGRPISVFGWFEFPATLVNIDNQEDIAGLFHWYLACSLMGLVALHILGSLKHQWIDKDGTLIRMLKPGENSK